MQFSSRLNSNAELYTSNFERTFIYLSNLLFSFFILNIGPIETAETIGFVILSIYTFNYATLYPKNKSAVWINIFCYSSIFIVILSTIFSSNIFSVFNASSIKIILMSSLVFSSNYYLKNNKLKNKYLENVGLFIPLICNFLFVLVDYSEIDIYDNSRHARNSFMIYDLLMSEKSNKLLHSIFYFDFYPNLVYLVNQFFIAILGKSTSSIQLCNLFFWLPLGYIFCKKILKEYCHISGLPISIAGLMIFSNQVVLYYQRSCLLDFPALSMAIVLIYYYLKTERFTVSKYSIFFGIAVSLGMLIKATFLIIGAGCILFYIVNIFIESVRIKKMNAQLIQIKLENIFLASIFIFMIGGLYYWINYNHFNFQLKEVTEGFGKREGDPYPYSLESFYYYIKIFFDYYGSIGTQIFILIFFFLFFFFFNKRKSLNTSLIFPLIIFYISATITWNKDCRTFMPALALLIPAFSSVELIKNKIFKTIIYSTSYLIFVFSIVNSITGNAFNYSFIKIKENYYFYQKPVSPDFINNLDAHYIFSFMHKQLFDEEIKEKLNIKVTTTNFSDELYASKYNNAFIDLKKEDIRHFSKIVYVKDEIYNDYYLFGITKHNDTLLKVKKLGSAAIIRGDIELKISGINMQFKDQKIEKTLLLSSSTETELRLPSNSYNNEINFKIYHSWSTAQLYDTYYKLMKRKENVYTNLIILNSDVKENKIDIRTIPTVNLLVNTPPQ